jgi:uncharacterized protein (TIRG00374 family)
MTDLSTIPRATAPIAARAPARTAWLRVGLGLAGLGSFGFLVAQFDLQKVSRAVGDASSFAWLALLAFPLSIAADALAWTRLLKRLKENVPFGKAFLVRLASEAIGNAVPLAGLASETAGPALLANTTSTPLTAAVASSAAKRWLIARSHATYVLLCVAAGFLIPSAHEAAVPVAICLGVACVLLSGSVATQLVAGKANVAVRVLGVLRNLPGVRTFFLQNHHGESFEEVDRHLTKLSSSITFDAWALVVLAWIFEGTETYLLLRAVGISVTWVDAVSLDGVLTALRSAAFVVPSGLGVQDAGFAYFLGDAAGSSVGAFLVLKRGKELFYIALGLTLYFVLHRATSRSGDVGVIETKAKGSLA